MTRHHVPLGLLILCLSLVTSCSKEPPAIAPGPHNTILISIDTLRADSLKLYSSSGVDAPALESLAEQGILFLDAVTQVPYTLPSHCTILTGQYPISHGVRDNIKGVLPPSIPTLAEQFKKRNYRTAAFLGSMVLGEHTGISRGFDYYDDFFSRSDGHGEDLGSIERRAGDVFASFRNWYETQRDARRYFVFLHFYDPHSPYDPPGSYVVGDSNRDLYRGEIRYVDQVLAGLFDILRQRGDWDDSIVQVVSDHGEMLGEHGEMTHGFLLYQPSLHVPMILKLPGAAGARTRIDSPVELVDVTPTLLDLNGIAVPAGVSGRTLGPQIIGRAKPERDRLVFSETFFPSIELGVSPQESVQDSNFKYIASPRAEFYDLRKDPNETHNLVNDNRAEKSRLAAALARFKKRVVAAAAPNQREVTSEEAEQFASLGYVGGGVEESQWDLTKDPKDYMQDWNRFLEATSLILSGNYERALGLFKQVRAAGSIRPAFLVIEEAKCYAALGDRARAEQMFKAASNLEGQTALASLYAETGRFGEAAELYRDVLKRKFSYFVLNNYLMMLARSGKRDEALALLREAEKEHSDPRSRPFFAEMYLSLREWNGAEEALMEMIRQRPWEAKWTLDLASVYQARAEIPKALDLMARNRDSFPDNPSYLLQLGILYHQAGQFDLEIAVFEHMSRTSPRDPRGYIYLAKALLEQKRDPRNAIGLALRGLSLNPKPDIQVFGHLVLGNAWLAAGNRAESEKEFGRAQELEKSLR